MAVVALVAGAHDLPDAGEESANLLKHPLAVDRVLADQLPLRRIKLAGLVDDLLGDLDLPDVVKEGAELHVALLGGVQLQIPGDRER
jgi:hypothetical protein